MMSLEGEIEQKRYRGNNLHHKTRLRFKHKYSKKKKKRERESSKDELGGCDYSIHRNLYL